MFDITVSAKSLYRNFDKSGRQESGINCHLVGDKIAHTSEASIYTANGDKGNYKRSCHGHSFVLYLLVIKTDSYVFIMKSGLICNEEA